MTIQLSTARPPRCLLVNVHTTDTYCTITQADSTYADILAGSTEMNQVPFLADISTAIFYPWSLAGLVFELDISDPAAARSRQYGSNGAWTNFVLTFRGDRTFLIDGTPFTRVEEVPAQDFDIRADTPPERYGLYFLVNQLHQKGESYPGM